MSGQAGGRSWVLAAGLGAVLVARTAPAASPTEPTPAQTHFGQALQLFDQGEIATACRTFEQSFQEEAAPGTLYNLALCHQREGQLGKAYRELDELATRAEEQKMTDKARAVRAKADALVGRLAILDLVHRADARADITSLSLDGESIPKESWRRPVRVDPAAHTLVVQHSDGVAVTRHVPASKAGQTVHIEMEDPAPVVAATPMRPVDARAAPPLEPHSDRRLAGYVTGGVGVALVLAGSVAGVVAIIKKHNVDTDCPVLTSCSGELPNGTARIVDAQRQQSAGREAADLATIGLSAGGAALVASAVLLLTSREEATPDERADARLATPSFLPFVDPHGAGVSLAARF